MASVRNATGQYEFLQLLARPVHAGVPLTEQHDLEAIAHELRGQLRGVPAIDDDLLDMVALTKLEDSLAMRS